MTTASGSPVQVTARAPFPDTVDRGSFRFISGLAAAEIDQVAFRGSWLDLAEGPWRAQAEAIYDRLSELVVDAGGLGSVLRLHLYQQDKRMFPVLETVRLEKEGATASPSSGVGVRTLHSSPTALYEADGIALSAAGRATYGTRTAIACGRAGASASHYSQVSQAGPYVFLAGVIPIDPETHGLIATFEDIPVEGRFLRRGRSHPDARTGPIAAQTWATYERIFAALAEVELGPEQVMSSTVFLAHAADAADFLRVHGHLFGA